MWVGDRLGRSTPAGTVTELSSVITFDSDTSITAVAPAEPAGVVDVTVTTPVPILQLGSGLDSAKCVEASTVALSSKDRFKFTSAVGAVRRDGDGEQSQQSKDACRHVQLQLIDHDLYEAVN